MFLGTPEAAVPSLEALLDSDLEVVGVVTNPDRPAGRGMKPTPPPVKRAAQAAGVEVAQPERARSPELHEWLRAKAPDVAVVVAYGKILPGSLLEIPPRGFVNVHFSLLPAYRGAAPVQRALMDGVSETGVSIMVLTEGMDEGPVLATAETAVGEDETGGQVGERLARMGADLLVPTLHAYLQGALEPHEQDHPRATYANKVTGNDARIDWSRPRAEIRNLVRALNPEPGAWTTFKGQRMKVHKVRPVDRDDLTPREIVIDGGIVVGAGDGPLALEEVQMAGKRKMSGEEFARGVRLDHRAYLE